MNKKFISAIMAGAMAVSALGVSAFADGFTANKQDNADYGTKAQSYKIAASVTIPEMKVTLPSAVNAVINPYGVSVKINDEAVVATNGIVSPIYTITNNSTELGIQVTATTSATASTGITMVTSALTASVTDSTAFKAKGDTKEAYAQVMVEVDAANNLTAPSTAATFGTVAEGATAPTNKLFHLKKAASATAAEKGYFQIQGEITRFDKADKEVKWTSSDKVNLVLVLDITPSNATTSAVD